MLVLEKSELGEGRRKQGGSEGQDPLLNFLNKGRCGQVPGQESIEF